MPEQQLPAWLSPPPEGRQTERRRQPERRGSATSPAAPPPAPAARKRSSRAKTGAAKAPTGTAQARTVAAQERRTGADRRGAQRRRAAKLPPGVAERRYLLAATILLLIYGLVMAYSASAAKAFFTYGSSWYFFERQLVYAVLGVVAMFVLARVDYRWWRRLALPLAIVVGILLVAVLIPGVGTQINGARRWILLGGQSLTPGEFAKMAAIMLVAGLAAERPREVLQAGGFARLVLIGIVPAGALIMLEPDLGTTIVLALAVVAVLVAAGSRLRHLLTLCLAAALAVLALIAVEPYRMQRLTAFIDPWQNPRGAGMQTVQSLVSIASGRIFGVGLGNSIQKFGFLPEQTTDSITGIIGEELGLLGLLALIGFYVFLAWAGYRIALSCRELFGKLLATGIVTAIVGQAFINIAAALGLLPLTGIPLPLVSLGGTSLVVVLMGIGIVANIATNRRSYIVVSVERRGGAHRRRRDGGAHDARPRRRPRAQK